MRTVLLMILAMLVPWSVTHADVGPTFDFKVYVLDPEQTDDVDVYGTFSAKDGQYGGIELAFYRDRGTYAIRAIDDMSDVAELPKEEMRRHEEDGIDFILRLFISPTQTSDGSAYLSGVAMLMENTSVSGPPLYRISEEPFSGVLAIAADTVLTFTAKSSGRQIKLGLGVNVRGARSATSGGDDGRFTMLFSLFNEDARRFEVENEPCDLPFLTESKSDGDGCTHRHMFRLENGDSLLYLMTYRFDDVSELDGGLVQITLTMERWFFVNPKRYFTGEVPEGGGGRTYGTGYRETKTTMSIDGKKRRVEAHIDKGTVVKFKWENVELTKSDIVKNWNDVVAILTQAEGHQFLYRPPRVDHLDEDSQAGLTHGLLGSPVNYTGSKVKSTTYSKTFTVEPRQDVEIDIPLGRGSLLPFKAREVVKMKWR